MSNPYQSPDPESKDPAGMDPPSSLPGKVRLLAILMLVQAGLQLAMGIAVIVMLFFVPQIFGKQLELQQKQDLEGSCERYARALLPYLG